MSERIVKLDDGVMATISTSGRGWRITTDDPSFTATGGELLSLYLRYLGFQQKESGNKQGRRRNAVKNQLIRLKESNDNQEIITIMQTALSLGLFNPFVMIGLIGTKVLDFKE